MKSLSRQYVSLLVAAAMSLGLAACSSDDLIVPGESGENGSGVYLDMTVEVPTSADSRASTDPESSQSYNSGVDGESLVNKIYLYFFDSNENVVTFTTVNGTSKVTKNYLEFSGSDITSTTGKNPEEGYTKDTGIGVAYHVGPTAVSQLKVNEKYYVYALCNHRLMTFTPPSSSTTSDLSFTTMTEFLNSTQSMASIAADGGYAKNVPMSSRAYDGTMCSTIEVKAENFSKSNPCKISLQVERSLARITFQNTSKVFTLYKDTNFSQSLGTIDIVSREVVNNPPGFYTFRHVGNINTSSSTKYTITTSLANKWSQQVGVVGSYVVTPYTPEQTKNVGCYASNDAPLVIVPSSKYYSTKKQHLFDWLTWDENTNGFEVYTVKTGGVIGMYAENVCEASSQNRGNCTAIVLRGQIIPSSSAIGDPSYAGYYADEYKSFYDYSTYKTTYQCSLFYYNGKFYYRTSSIKALDSTKFYGLTKSNYKNYSGIRKFTYGFGYYIYYPRHSDNKDDTTMGVMEFSLVRNNSYDITINKVALPPYTDDEIQSLTTSDMLKDVEQQQTYVSAVSSINSMSLSTSELPIGD